MKSKPEPWIERGRLAGITGDMNGHFRVVGPDGRMLTIVASNGDGWDEEHAQLACPTWLEMDWVKRQFFTEEECAIQLHVPEKDHINLHDFVLHIWRPTLTPIPRPPSICV